MALEPPWGPHHRSSWADPLGSSASCAQHSPTPGQPREQVVIYFSLCRAPCLGHDGGGGGGGGGSVMSDSLWPHGL